MSLSNALVPNFKSLYALILLIRRLAFIETGLDLMTTLIIARMIIHPATGADEPEAYESIAALMTERTKGIEDTTPFSGPHVKEIYEEYMESGSNIFRYWENVKAEWEGKRGEVIKKIKRGYAANAIGQVLDSYCVDGL